MPRAHAAADRLLEISGDLAKTDTRQWLNAEDGFFDAEAGLDAAEAQDDSDSEGELTEDEDD